MLRPKLTQHGILHKPFKSKMRGYDPTEVDKYLDQVIKDYGAFKAIIQGLRKLNARETAQNNELRAKLKKSKAGDMTQSAYIAISQRLTQLEAVLYKRSK